MTPEEFVHHKSQILDGIDLSRKGCIDDPVKGLVHLINEGSEFVTTSSCSGRVIVFCEVCIVVSD
jgi:tRNA wybutosine-synthesizing protein 3